MSASPVLILASILRVVSYRTRINPGLGLSFSSGRLHRVPWPAATPAEEDRRQELVSGSPIAQIACCLPRPLKKCGPRQKKLRDESLCINVRLIHIRATTGNTFRSWPAIDLDWALRLQAQIMCRAGARSFQFSCTCLESLWREPAGYCKKCELFASSHRNILFSKNLYFSEQCCQLNYQVLRVFGEILVGPLSPIVNCGNK